MHLLGKESDIKSSAEGNPETMCSLVGKCLHSCNGSWACQQTPLSRQHLSPCRLEALEQNVEVSSSLLHGGDSLAWAAILGCETVFPQLRAVLLVPAPWPLENSLFSSFTCLAFRCIFSDLSIQPLVVHAPHRDAQR